MHEYNTVFDILKDVDYRPTGFILENNVLTGMYRPYFKGTMTPAPMISEKRYPYLYIEFLKDAGFIEFDDIPKIIEIPSALLKFKFEFKTVD